MRVPVHHQEKGRKTHPHKSAILDVAVVVRALAVLDGHRFGDDNLSGEEYDLQVDILRNFVKGGDDGSEV